MAEDKQLTQIEHEALISWREWPIFIVLRLKYLQEIEDKLKVSGETPSRILRRDQLITAQTDHSPAIESQIASSNFDYVGHADDPDIPDMVSAILPTDPTYVSDDTDGYSLNYEEE